VSKRHFAKVTRHGNSAMLVLPRPFLYHLDCLFGDYVRLAMNPDGSVTLSKGETSGEISGPRNITIEDRPSQVKL
jgi:hypothetical protein